MLSLLDFEFMEVLFDMLKGFLVGICASAPIGPIAILVIQKSLSKGHMSGFVSGLGATVSDTCYAFIAIFALAFAQRFIDAHQSFILLAGGIILILVGASMALSLLTCNPSTVSYWYANLQLPITLCSYFKLPTSS